MAIYTGTSKHLGGTEKVPTKEQFFYGLVQKNVLVTGANGQLGQELKKFSETANIPLRFLFTDSDSLDILDINHVDSFVAHNAVQYIINCAAYTAVDKAEVEPELAFAINAQGVKNVAMVAKKRGVKLIHISTDFVFDGSSTIPYTEEMQAQPLSVYGASKLKGEEDLQAVGGDWMIIRTSWLFSEFASNFVKTMIRLMKDRDQLTVVSDQIGSPTYAADLAEMIVHILQFTEEQQTWNGGIYHFANQGETSWYHFAKEIQRLANTPACTLQPVTTEVYGSPATRPPYSVLQTTKICNTFHVEIPKWEEALRRCMHELKK